MFCGFGIGTFLELRWSSVLYPYVHLFLARLWSTFSSDNHTSVNTRHHRCRYITSDRRSTHLPAQYIRSLSSPSVFTLEYLGHIADRVQSMVSQTIKPSRSYCNDRAAFYRCHRKDIRSHLGNEGTPASTVQSIMALLVESGFLYCITWVSRTTHLIESKDLKHIIFVRDHLGVLHSQYGPANQG